MYRGIDDIEPGSSPGSSYVTIHLPHVITIKLVIHNNSHPHSVVRTIRGIGAAMSIYNELSDICVLGQVDLRNRLCLRPPLQPPSGFVGAV